MLQLSDDVRAIVSSSCAFAVTVRDSGSSDGVAVAAEAVEGMLHNTVFSLCPASSCGHDEEVVRTVLSGPLMFFRGQLRHNSKKVLLVHKKPLCTHIEQFIPIYLQVPLIFKYCSTQRVQAQDWSFSRAETQLTCPNKIGRTSLKLIGKRTKHGGFITPSGEL